MLNKLCTWTFIACSSSILTGCASSMHPFGEDHLTITGTPGGFDSFFDGVDAVAQSAKGDPHTATNAARHKHDKELTKRAAFSVSLGGAKHE